MGQLAGCFVSLRNGSTPDGQRERERVGGDKLRYVNDKLRQGHKENPLAGMIRADISVPRSLLFAVGDRIQSINFAPTRNRRRCVTFESDSHSIHDLEERSAKSPLLAETEAVAKLSASRFFTNLSAGT